MVNLYFPRGTEVEALLLYEPDTANSEIVSRCSVIQNWKRRIKVETVFPF